MAPELQKVIVCCLITAASLSSMGARCGTGGSAEVHGTDAAGDTVFVLADHWPPAAGKLYGIGNNADDGTQLGDSWYQDGYADALNSAGHSADGSHRHSAQIRSTGSQGG